MVRVGTLKLGAYFMTTLTGRAGTVIRRAKRRLGHDAEVCVALEEPEEEKNIHEAVFVSVEVTH